MGSEISKWLRNTTVISFREDRQNFICDVIINDISGTTQYFVVLNNKDKLTLKRGLLVGEDHEGRIEVIGGIGDRPLVFSFLHINKNRNVNITFHLINLIYLEELCRLIHKILFFI